MAQKSRTAVLVVHGIGSQRPLETVRGVINAVWFDDDDHEEGSKKLWSHPEPSGVDLDLTVMTTNEINGTGDKRCADFHELYWAHQMSETKAVAVLLWLFELGRRGPYFKTGMNGLWWCGAVYLCLMLLSVSLLTLQALVWIAGIADTPYDFISVVMLMIMVGVAASAIAAYWYGYWKLFISLGLMFAVFVSAACFALSYGLFAPGSEAQLVAARLTNAIFVPVLALVAVYLLMKCWGLCAFAMTYGFSLVFFGVFLLSQWTNGGWPDVIAALHDVKVPWGLPSHASTIAALTILAVYLVMNVGFLQPYLGDAARYFRNSPANVAARRAIRKNAVDTLDQLHRSRDYDRIIVVAHSLGTAVAYDMLRAYYSRICSQIPVDQPFKEQFKQLDDGALGCGATRPAGRALIHELVARSKVLDRASRREPYRPATSEQVDAWLVTDFVTLGSPLTHAKYLMTNEEDGANLERAFFNHVHEREFPTCPPQELDDDGLVFYTDPRGILHMHHGGMFALTRWTNLCFPVTNILWGDAIGGPVVDVFCPYVKGTTSREVKPGFVKDEPVSTRQKPVSNRQTGGATFFSHIDYWKTDCRPKGRAAPHLQTLIDAIDLADRDKPVQP